MISKILFTALIILTALLFIRHRGAAASRQQQALALATEKRQAMVIAIVLVALTVSISGLLYYLHWAEQHRLFTVRVVNSHTGVVQRYQVYQTDLDGRRFRTVDGRLIHLSDSERMEVQEGVNDSGE